MKQDIRITKTHMALRHAMITLLNQKTFRKITVNDLCEAAMTSRATFYAHFEDKYALLRYTLQSLKDELLAQAELEPGVDLLRLYIRYMYNHQRMFKNLLADEGSLELSGMVDQMLAQNLHHHPLIKQCIGDVQEAEIILQYAIGGMNQIVQWVIREGFRQSPDLIADQLIRIRDMFLQEFLKISP